MKIWMLTALFLLLPMYTQSVYAQSFFSGNVEMSATDEEPSEYFTIDEGARKLAGFSTPMTLLSEGVESVGELTRPLDIPLTRWLKHNASPQLPSEKYNRLKHFGTWVNDPNDNTCFNTRAKVLIRDSKKPVTFKPSNKCVVDTGSWPDPYTGKTLTSSKDIQIDHVVPLKHAYQTGAWRWSYKTRCLYANFMSDNYHLLSVSGHENMSKGDKSPDEYMPPNPRVSCGYLQIWLQIKLAWNLVLFPTEIQSIHDLMVKNHCDLQKMTMNRNELAALRKTMNELIPICKEPKKAFDEDADLEIL